MIDKVKAVVERDGRYLCLLRDYDDVVYAFPGGSVEDYDDTELDAVLRELEEETGLMSDIYSDNSFFEGLTPVHYYKSIDANLARNIYPFHVKVDPGFEPEISDEHTGYEWLTEDELVSSIDDEKLTHYRHLFFRYVEKFQERSPSKTPIFTTTRFGDDDEENIKIINEFLDEVA